MKDRQLTVLSGPWKTGDNLRSWGNLAGSFYGLFLNNLTQRGVEGVHLIVTLGERWITQIQQGVKYYQNWPKVINSGPIKSLKKFINFIFSVFCWQWSYSCQWSTVAPHHWSSRSSWKMDQEHGEGEQPLRHQVHRSRWIIALIILIIFNILVFNSHFNILFLIRI